MAANTMQLNNNGTLNAEVLEEYLKEIRLILTEMRYPQIELVREPVERHSDPGCVREYDKGPELSIYIKGYLSPTG